MRSIAPTLILASLIAAPATAADKSCDDGRVPTASRPCAKLATGKKRPTFLPTDKSNLAAYRQNLADFRAQAVDDLAAKKLTQAQFNHKLGQYNHAIAELNARGK